MKLCDLTQFYSPVSGGVRRYLERKRAYLLENRPDWSHVLVVPGEADAVSGCARARTYTVASPLVSRTSRYRALLRLHLVEEILERERPDLIESGDPYQLAWKAIASGRGLGLPVVGFYHSHFPQALLRTVAKFSGRVGRTLAEEIAWRYVEALYNEFAATIVPGPGLAAELRARGIERLHVVDLGVDTEVFRPAPGGRPAARARLGIEGSGPWLLYVGRLAPEKNVECLWEAFRLLRQAGEPCSLLVVGDGPLRPKLQRLARETGAVNWVPYCDDSARLADFYRAADLFVHPGIQETFGLVTLESQACGTPVVGIRGSYMDRIVFCDQMLWAERDDAEALAAAIAAHLRSGLEEAGRRASEAVRARFSWQRAFERLLAIYEQIRQEWS